MSETHVDDGVNMKELHIENYKMENCVTQNRRTGGVLIYISKEYMYKTILKEIVENFIWILGIEIKIGKENFQIITIYHPPNTKDNLFTEYFEKLIENIEFKGNLIITGDFNFDFQKETYYVKKIKRMLYQNGLYQIIKSPTRITQYSSTIIDYVITNKKDTSHVVHLTPKISDHNIITVDTNELQTKNKNEHVVVKKRLLKNYNLNLFQSLLIDKPWNNNISNVHVLASTLVKNIIESLDVICPIKEIKIESKHVDNKWINEEIIGNLKERDFKYKRAVFTNENEDWVAYRQKRNIVSKMIRTCKEKYYNNVITSNSHNGRELWKQLKKLLPNKTHTSSECIEFSNIQETNEDIIADKFNAFFITSIEEITSNINCINTYEQILENIEQKGSFHSFQATTMTKLRKIIVDLKNTVDCEDMLTTKIVQDAFSVIGNQFLDVINLSLQYGVFPEGWKTSCVIPVPKVTNTILCEEHRPINMVPVYEKILEIEVKDQLLEFCDKNSVLVCNQSGFRKLHSCESAILNICEEWYKSLENNHVILAVFLDFRRAFETLNRELLLCKLERIGLTGDVLNWFKTYLDPRTQNVKFRNSLSDKLQTIHGVPQGTVLGPILFNLYINDIVKYVKYCKISMFADDTMIYIEGDDIPMMFNSMNYDLSVISKWLCDNSLSLNISKSKYMLIGNKFKLSKYNLSYPNLNLEIMGNKLDKVNEIKYLGVIIDEHLNFKSHFNYIMNKMSKKVYFLRRISNCLNMSTKILLYKSLISPHIDFCSTILFNLNQNEVHKIQVIQNKAMRIILKCNKYTPINTMLEVLHFMNVKQRILFRTLDMIFKIKNKMAPDYLRNKIKYVRDVHTYNTRNVNDFFIDTPQSKRLAKTLFYKGLTEFNQLPENIKQCNNYQKFKKQLSAYVLECQRT